MVMITGLLRDATGLPLTSPLSITLTDYGVAPPSTLYLPAKIVVQPDLNGAFSVDLWANQSSAHPCLYRVETPQGSSFLISVPGGELGPLDIGNLVATKADLREDTNILNRIARLEANGGGTGPSPGGGGGELLTLGDGLVGGSYDGSAPVTVSVANTIARLNSPTFTSPRSNTPAAGDNSTLLATTAWSSNAGNITSGTLPSARLPSNLVATTAQRLATPRSILGTPFDGTADIPPLTLGSGLVASSASSLNIDFNVVASAEDTRFTNSREWTATTVTQIEAESGTDVNRRAWTAQRVRQAITAWWAGVEGTLARLVSPAFTGTPTAPTAPVGDASTRLATTAFSSNATNLTSGTVPIARIPTLNQDTTGISASAAKLTTARSILGLPFDGTADLPLALGNGVVVTNGVLGLDPAEPRLTDAREWTASTITQAESEGGIATTRRAWTAQRVRQAITAWWATLDNTIARLASPSFTGTPLAPTPTSGDSSTRIATTAWAGNASNLTLGTISAARVPTLNQNTTGNAATATKLATARGISLNGGAVATGVSFDGTANIALNVSSLNAATLTGTYPPIKMPATQVASSDPNTFDDYEEGTWTPELTYTSPGTSSITLNRNTGRYQKVGNRVNITFDIRVNTFSKGTASGYLIISGLPFPTRAGGGYDNNYGFLVVANSPFTGIPFVDTATGLSGGNNTLYIFKMVSNSVNVPLEDPIGGALYWGQLQYETTN